MKHDQVKLKHQRDTISTVRYDEEPFGKPLHPLYVTTDAFTSPSATMILHPQILLQLLPRKSGMVRA